MVSKNVITCIIAGIALGTLGLGALNTPKKPKKLVERAQYYLDLNTMEKKN